MSYQDSNKRRGFSLNTCGVITSFWHAILVRSNKEIIIISASKPGISLLLSHETETTQVDVFRHHVHFLFVKIF